MENIQKNDTTGSNETGDSKTVVSEAETSRTPTVEVPAVMDREIDFQDMLTRFIAWIKKEGPRDERVQFVDSDGCNVDHLIHGEKGGKVEIHNALLVGERLARLCSRATAAMYSAREKCGLERNKGPRPMSLEQANRILAQRGAVRDLFLAGVKDESKRAVAREKCGLDHEGCGDIRGWIVVPREGERSFSVAGLCGLACRVLFSLRWDNCRIYDTKEEAAKEAQQLTARPPHVNRKSSRPGDRRDREERKAFSPTDALAAKEAAVANLEARKAAGQNVEQELDKQRKLLALAQKMAGVAPATPASAPVPVEGAPKPVRDPQARKAQDRQRGEGEDGDDSEGLKAIAQERARKGRRGGTPSGDPDGNEHAALGTVGEMNPGLAVLRDQLPQG